MEYYCGPLRPALLNTVVKAKVSTFNQCRFCKMQLKTSACLVLECCSYARFQTATENGHSFVRSISPDILQVHRRCVAFGEEEKSMMFSRSDWRQEQAESNSKETRMNDWLISKAHELQSGRLLSLTQRITSLCNRCVGFAHHLLFRSDSFQLTTRRVAMATTWQPSSV